MKTTQVEVPHPKFPRSVLLDNRASPKRCAVSDDGVLKRARLEEISFDLGRGALQHATLSELCEAKAMISEAREEVAPRGFELPEFDAARAGLYAVDPSLRFRAAGVSPTLRRLPSWVFWYMRWTGDGIPGHGHGRWEKRALDFNGTEVEVSSDIAGARFNHIVDIFDLSLQSTRNRNLPREHNLRPYYSRHNVGVGLLLRPRYDLLAIDLDEVVDMRTRTISPVARSIVEHFDSYTELSPGLRGLRIFVYGFLPAGARERIQPHGSKFGIHDRNKLATVTGYSLKRQTKSIRDCSYRLLEFYNSYIRPDTATRAR